MSTSGLSPFALITLVLVGAYALTVLAGVVGGLARGAPPPDDPQQLAAVEQRFGRYRDGVRDGRPRVMARASVAVFLNNFLGELLQFTLFGALIVPGLLLLLIGAWRTGRALPFVRGSRPLSTLLYFGVGTLEWATYPLMTAVGVHFGLAVVAPTWVGHVSRSAALSSAFSDGALVLATAALVLLVQAMLEVLYVRAVLRRGGTGVPLMPW